MSGLGLDNTVTTHNVAHGSAHKTGLLVPGKGSDRIWINRHLVKIIANSPPLKFATRRNLLQKSAIIMYMLCDKVRL